MRGRALPRCAELEPVLAMTPTCGGGRAEGRRQQRRRRGGREDEQQTLESEIERMNREGGEEEDRGGAVDLIRFSRGQKCPYEST